MNSYTLELESETVSALAAIRVGVRRVGITGRAKNLNGVFGCELELISGEVIFVCADQRDLEYKFEVFPLTAKRIPAFTAAETKLLTLAAAVDVCLMQTQDWLDTGIPCIGAIGQNPIMQCQGAPSSPPDQAVAACIYIGGLQLHGSNSELLTIATLPFPYAIYVSCFDGCGSVDINDYSIFSLPNAG
jgi:hypothetical protein